MEKRRFSQGFLSVNGIKFYESKMNLNWKPIIKSIQEVRTLQYSLHMLARRQLNQTSHVRQAEVLQQHLELNACFKLLHSEVVRTQVQIVMAVCECVQDPDGFLDNGGWNFLDAEGDSSDEEGDESEEEGALS